MTRFIDDYLLYLLARASGRASAAFHGQLAEQGIPVSTWRILASLYPDTPASISALCESCMTKQPTMTRQIDRLKASGLVSRVPAEDGDRRKVTVRLTEKGRALTDRLVVDAKRHETAVLKDYAPNEITRMKHLLRDLADD